MLLPSIVNVGVMVAIARHFQPEIEFVFLLLPVLFLCRGVRFVVACVS
jgi:hypothetical protein